MKQYLIGYDLNGDNPNYSDLIEKIKGLSEKRWWHHLDSTFIIFSTKTAEQLLSELDDCLDKEDELLIVEIAEDVSWASTGFSEKGQAWLDKYL